MTEAEAQLILGATANQDTEALNELYEEAVFEQASFFMRRVFIPKLAEARIRKLESISKAGVALGIEQFSEDFNLEIDFSSLTTHAALIVAYNLLETKIKLALSNTVSALEAINAYQKWIELFRQYAKLFLETPIDQFDDISVKLTEAPIFHDFKSASKEERKHLIAKEYSRLRKLTASGF
ncbi:MAG: hypothetical protein AAGC47_08290 [Bacteroidota bacterium]